jgi:hypothetical protein
MKDKTSIQDLQARGFYPYPAGSAAELLCANGEVHVGMKDGVQYVLRFGETVADTGDEPTEGRNRYLFVTARVDMDKFPQPELEVVPDLPKGAEEPAVGPTARKTRQTMRRNRPEDARTSRNRKMPRTGQPKPKRTAKRPKRPSCRNVNASTAKTNANWMIGTRESRRPRNGLRN